MASAHDLDVADTLSPEDATTSPPPPSIASWDRYELLGELGKGGMGEVHKARDRRLGRIVAIKFILAPDPNLTIRLLREARAQARIDHPNVCRIYEVGEVAGRAYIAIQFVDGEPLHRAAARMSLDEKLAALRDVARAVHEAHRLGIVHRDLKPANVMVERTDDGRWVPVVMDFGLAREATVEPGLTASGAPLGTPAYMSPEQARGDLGAIDRRSDVYSLGATLYELLTGRPPFAATSLAAALARVIHDEPPPPRRVVASVPADLEIIALKCLAKDPNERYPSARSLAEDLDHYLAGEPIEGRRRSRWRRLRQRARRHRELVGVAAGALVIVAAVSALGVRASLASRAERARAAERTRLAERLGQDTKAIELAMREAYELPLHDLRPDRDRIRARMRTIAATPHDVGALGDAIVHAALGRGHFALHDWQRAADELSRAVAVGLASPEVHAARGRALGELYHRALEVARRSSDPATLARRTRELTAQYLTPALAELEVGRASGDDAALLDPLIALYRGDLAGAERRAGELAAGAPWLFEARQLAGDAAYASALAAFDRGDYAAADPAFDRAVARYAEASEIARSDPSLYDAAAQALIQRAENEFRRGRAPREALDRALDTIDRALRADPADATAFALRGAALLRWYRTPALRGTDDPRPLLDRIADAQARAAELDPDNPRAWDALGNTYMYRGSSEAGHGGDPTPWWNRALAELDRARAIQPDDPWVHNDLGIVHASLGTRSGDTGGDPMRAWDTALRSYQRATELDPHYLYAWCNQVDLHASIAERQAADGVDPHDAVERAEAAGARGLAIDPNYYSLLNTMAQAELARARFVVDRGADPAEALARAHADLDRADAIHPDNLVTWFYRVVAANLAGAGALATGKDPSRAIADAHAALARALRLRPDCRVCPREAARLGLIEAAWARHGAPALLTRARDQAERAVTLEAPSAEAALTAAEVLLQLATLRPSRAVVDRALAYVDQALTAHPGLARAPALRAALERLR